MNAITKVRQPNTSVNWRSAANLWTFAGLVFTALACAWVATRLAPESAPAKSVKVTRTVAGETTVAPVDERIELAQVGTAVWSHNPSGEEDLQFGDHVDPATWKHLILRSKKQDDSFCDINLLRPDWWVEDEAAQRGGTIYILVPECGIDGDAEVLDIRPCPRIQKCPAGYQTITGTFHHQNARLIDLYIEGLNKPIGSTPNHPFWSVDRKEFVSASELAIGETLLGQLGATTVVSQSVRPDVHSVFNIEILNSHTYHVTASGLLVHNAVPCKQTKQGGKFTEPDFPDRVIVPETNGVVIEHYYKGGDHGPPHAHVRGGGESTRIGQNGRPLESNPELTATQRKVVEENLPAIRKALRQIGKWFRFENMY